jgi:thiol-disulfide isomerase/thioredoxin
MLPLGTRAPDFRLPDPSGIVVSLADFQSAPALLVIFMCNHCPYVKHIRDGLAKLARDYRSRNLAVVGIYLFHNDRRLVYRGQFDDSRPGNGIPVTGKDLRAALDAVLADKPVSPQQKPSIGCNIKWKPGNEPEYS